MLTYDLKYRLREDRRDVKTYQRLEIYSLLGLSLRSFHYSLCYLYPFYIAYRTGVCLFLDLGLLVEIERKGRLLSVYLLTNRFCFLLMDASL